MIYLLTGTACLPAYRSCGKNRQKNGEEGCKGIYVTPEGGRPYCFVVLFLYSVGERPVRCLKYLHI